MTITDPVNQNYPGTDLPVPGDGAGDNGAARSVSKGSPGASPPPGTGPKSALDIAGIGTTAGYAPYGGVPDDAFLQAALGYGSAGGGGYNTQQLGQAVLVDYSGVTQAGVADVGSGVPGPGEVSLADFFGDVDANTGQDQISGLTPSQTKTKITFGEALAMPRYEDKALISSLQARLMAANYYGDNSTGQAASRNSTLPYIDGVYDDATSKAYARLLMDAQGGVVQGMSVDDILNQRAQENKNLAGSATTQHGDNTVTTQDITGAPTLDNLMDKVLPAILGRGLNDDEKAQIVNSVQSAEMVDQAGVSGAEMGAHAANRAIDNQQGVGGGNLIKEAQKYLGLKYVYGGNSLTDGADCSGFVQQIFAKFGIDVGRDTSAQRQTAGQDVGGSVKDLGNARPGDLLFFGDAAGPSAHVGIYLGNGQMISAPNPHSGVRVDSVAAWDSSGETLNQIKRVSGENNGSVGTDTTGDQAGEPAGLSAFMGAISGRESGGNYDAQNSGGAHGKYQIMPASWSQWAPEAGLTADAPQTPENQERVARFEMSKMYRETGSWEKVASQWFSGDPNGYQTTPDKSDGNMTVSQYVADVMQRMGTSGAAGTSTGTTDSGTNPTDKYVGTDTLATHTNDNAQPLVEQQAEAAHPELYHSANLANTFGDFLKIINSASPAVGG